MQTSQAPPVATRDDLSIEEDLVRRARGDPEAFAALYDRYVDRVYRYAYRRLGSHPDAEDLTAQTFHRALEGMDRYEWRGLPFGAWLFRIAHNLTVNRRRAGTPPVSLDGLGDGIDPVDMDASTPEQIVGFQEEMHTVWAAVATLPRLQQRAVTLRFGRDLSHAEVGVLIGRSEAATKQLIYRAMKTLRLQLQEN